MYISYWSSEISCQRSGKLNSQPDFHPMSLVIWYLSGFDDRFLAQPWFCQRNAFQKYYRPATDLVSIDLTQLIAQIG